jgi:hypothetical protein
MKFPSWLIRLSTVEIVVAIIFILYIVLPVQTPSAMVPVIHSPLGLIVICMIILYLFIFCNPILAVLYLGVAYLLLRRQPAVRKSDKPPTVPTIPIPQNSHMPQQQQQQQQQRRTLEEDVVANMAPVGQNSGIVNTSFKPVASNTSGAAPA